MYDTLLDRVLRAWSSKPFSSDIDCLKLEGKNAIRLEIVVESQTDEFQIDGRAVARSKNPRVGQALDEDQGF